MKYLLDALTRLDEAHNLVAKSPLDLLDYTEISGEFIKLKAKIYKKMEGENELPRGLRQVREAGAVNQI